VYPFIRSKPGSVIITLPYLTPSARVSSLELTAFCADCAYNTERQPISFPQIWSCRVMSCSFPAGRFQGFRYRRSNFLARILHFQKVSLHACRGFARSRIRSMAQPASHESGYLEGRSYSARKSRAASADAGWRCCSVFISLMMEAMRRGGKGDGVVPEPK